MKAAHIRQAVLASVLGAAAVVTGSSAPSSLLARDAEPQPLMASATTMPVEVSAGRQWFTATRAALDAPLAVRVPFAQRRDLADDSPGTFEFAAYRGQVLEVTLAREGAAPENARIFVEVFRVVDVLGQPLRERLTAMRPSGQQLRTRLPRDGTYQVLVQSAGRTEGHYRVALELDAALPFPVVGARRDAIRSLFGASRDSGSRDHHGIDIFVQRLTPVLAVAAGTVTPSKDELGGNTVWLNTPGTSYYYAHLDRVAVRPNQRVKPGDVLGYVGNTVIAR
jgi:murein DD-endopeptidase MepM/ murein hydrolase activator NlpD